MSLRSLNQICFKYLEMSLRKILAMFAPHFARSLAVKKMSKELLADAMIRDLLNAS